MLHVTLLLDAGKFGSRITPERPQVEFGDAVAKSEQQTATTLDLLNRADSVSTSTKVKVLHPEWDDTAVRAEVSAILAETGAWAPIPSGTSPPRFADSENRNSDVAHSSKCSHAPGAKSRTIQLRPPKTSTAPTTAADHTGRDQAHR